MKREWLKAKLEELRVEKVEPREKWEELRVDPEEEESRGLVSPRSATREVEPITIEELYMADRKRDRGMAGPSARY